ncbi:838_t:CDS:1 [Dentiscutata erythropus]|uniref:838_t:CDS:1 n=1 Tax=Dentiscutata erythropus TaxID=1348616 RepID=A0A9N8VPL0_9GLOM|nr:838_t:CDS:1 [Dentiscutata erythropus]
MATGFPKFIHSLLEPVPQYVIGCLPALAIVGASPINKFSYKLIWIFRCLGCPFMGVFSAVNIGGDKRSRCLFWLSSDYFEIRGSPSTSPKCKPIGFHAMKVSMYQTMDTIDKSIDLCTARASVLERFSSLVSAYYILVGIIAGISRALGAVSCQDWPYIPILLSWTIPALFRRAFSGNLVVKDPKKMFRKIKIVLEPKSSESGDQHFIVTLTAFASIILPWTALLLAYLTPPVGYFCRSKYITIICGIWSLNSFIAFISHCVGEKNLRSGFLHVWFAFWGVIIAILLLALAILTENYIWWNLFGKSCDISSIGC